MADKLNLRTPNSYAGTSATQTKQGSLRFATAAEAAAGVMTNVAISPATANSVVALDFASPPVLGFGSTTPRPVHATTLDSTGLTSLSTVAGSTTNIGTATGLIGFYGATAIVKPISTTDLRTALINLGLYTTGGASPLNLNGGALTAAGISGTTLTSTSTTSIATTGAVAANIGNASGTVGFFGATAVAKPAATDDLRTALINLGLYTTGGASPLNLNGGTLTAGVVSSAATVTAGTTITATSGDITATNGNFVSSAAGKGILLNSPTASGAAGGAVTVNGRSGRVTFTGPSIAAGASVTLTMTNSAITGSGTFVMLSMSGVTASSALTIQSKTASAGSLAIVMTNGTGATTSTADISFDFLILN